MLITLTGCSSFQDILASDRVDYQAALTTAPLAIPPDLSAIDNTPSYIAPPTAKQLKAQQFAKTISQDKSSHNSTEIASIQNNLETTVDRPQLQVEHDQMRYWLHISHRSPSELWPEIKSFWQANGFVILTESPATGVMETDWAENRAKIPNDWFRRSLGKLVDSIYSSGTRDKFTIRLENAANNGTDIFITHSGMEEVAVGRSKEFTRWEARPIDHNLEIAFIKRLIESFGLNAIQADALVKNAKNRAEKQLLKSGSNSIAILNDSYEKAWPRISLALDRSGYVVQSSDQSKGKITVRYTNFVKEGQPPGLFSRLFSAKPASSPIYELQIEAIGAKSTKITILNNQGQVDNSPAAQKLMTALAAAL